MGVITTKKSLVQLEKLSTASFCRRRLSVVMVRRPAWHEQGLQQASPHSANTAPPFLPACWDGAGAAQDV